MFLQLKVFYYLLPFFLCGVIFVRCYFHSLHFGLLWYGFLGLFMNFVFDIAALLFCCVMFRLYVLKLQNSLLACFIFISVFILCLYLSAFLYHLHYFFNLFSFVCICFNLHWFYISSIIMFTCFSIFLFFFSYSPFSSTFYLLYFFCFASPLQLICSLHFRFILFLFCFIFWEFCYVEKESIQSFRVHQIKEMMKKSL